jgi:hypothetical protein
LCLARQVFLKNEQAQQLEFMREQALTVVAVKIQKYGRRWVVRFRYKKWREIMVNLRAAIAARSSEMLDQWLDMSAELPHHGSHVTEVKQARALKQRLLEEKRVTGLLDGAIQARDLSGLRAAVAAADGMTPPLVNASVTGAKALIARLEEEIAAKQALQAAINQRNKTKLSEALRRAEGLQLECDETRQGYALLNRLEEEEEVTLNLRTAIADRNLTTLTAFLSKADEMGFEVAEVTQGKALQKQLQAELAAKTAVQNAIKDRDMASLRAALEKAAQVGLAAGVAEVAEGKALLALLEREAAAIAALLAAAEARDMGRLTAAIGEAQTLGLMSSAELANAVSIREHLLAVERNKEDLKAATASKDAGKLTSALSEAVRLGTTGPEVDAARTASQKLGAQSDTRGKLSALLASDDLAAIEAALRQAEQLGLGATPEAVSLQERKKVLEQEQVVFNELNAALAAGDLQALSRALAAALSSGVATKHPAVIARAKEEVTRLGDNAKAVQQLSSAVRARDLDAVRQGLERAQQLGIRSAEVTEASELLTELEMEHALLSQIAQAGEAKNFATLESLLNQAGRTKIPGDRLQPFKVLLDRSKNTGKARDALVEATSKRSFKELQEAIEVAIQLGLEGPEVQRAKEARDELARVEGVKHDLAAAINTLETKAENERGINESDLEPIAVAMDRALAQGVSEDDQEIQRARALQERLRQQLLVQAQLKEALRSEDVATIKRAIDAAEDLELTRLEDLRSAKAKLKSLDTSSLQAQEQSQEETDHDEIERQRQERRNRARNPKYNFKNYSGLRTPDDFAKGVMLNKKKVKEAMLKWQNTLISKSLLEMDSNLSKLALQIHKSLLGYMGDKQMAFPATLAQDILQHGWQEPGIRDEIYMQILKQLTGNQKAESIAKGWQMLCMCVTTFPPSPSFQDYLLNYILERENTKGAIRNYARYCLRTLEGMLSSGASGFVPTVEEISAYKERPPILATIELVDGTIISEELPVTPDLNVGKVIGICAHFLELKDSRAGNFGIFVYDVPGEPEYLLPKTDDAPPPPYHDLPRTPRALSSNDFMGSILVEKVRQRRNYKFVFKRKVRPRAV